MLLSPGDTALDYAYADPDPLALVLADVKLVVRYISPNRSNDKNLTLDELTRLLPHVAVLLVWEATQTAPLGGAILGKLHGELAGAFARDLGYPSIYLIVIAVDFDVQPYQMNLVLAYIAAFRSACGYPTGVYGKDTVVTAAHDADLSELGWQTLAWSGGRRSPHTDVVQWIGHVHPSITKSLGSVDDNTVLRSFAAWSKAPTVIPLPIEVEPMKSGHYRDDRIDGEWQVWWVNRDWRDSLYAYPIDDAPRGGDYDLLDQLPDGLPVARFGVLDAIMRRQNRPTPLPVAEAPVIDLATITAHVVASVKTEIANDLLNNAA